MKPWSLPLSIFMASLNEIPISLEQTTIAAGWDAGQGGSRTDTEGIPLVLLSLEEHKAGDVPIYPRLGGGHGNDMSINAFKTMSEFAQGTRPS